MDEGLSKSPLLHFPDGRPLPNHAFCGRIRDRVDENLIRARPDLTRVSCAHSRDECQG